MVTRYKLKINKEYVVITDKLYKVRVGKKFEVKTVNGDKVNYLNGQWIIGIFIKLNGKLMLLSEGIYFRLERFDQFQKCEIGSNLDMNPGDNDMTFQELVKQYLHKRSHHYDDGNYFSGATA